MSDRKSKNAGLTRVSHTGCLECDKKKLQYCLHQGNSKGGGGGSDASNSDDGHLDLTANPAPLKDETVVKLVFSKEQDREEIPENITQNAYYIPSLVPIYTIRKELEAFIMELAQQLGMDVANASVSEIGKRLGITYQDNGDNLSVSMPKNNFYNFIARLDAKHLIQIPQFLQDEYAAHKAQTSPVNANKSSPEKPFNPQPYYFRTALKPENFE